MKNARRVAVSCDSAVREGAGAVERAGEDGERGPHEPIRSETRIPVGFSRSRAPERPSAPAGRLRMSHHRGKAECENRGRSANVAGIAGDGGECRTSNSSS